jgi:hypothetical protein
VIWKEGEVLYAEMLSSQDFMHSSVELVEVDGRWQISRVLD